MQLVSWRFLLPCLFIFSPSFYYLKSKGGIFNNHQSLFRKNRQSIGDIHNCVNCYFLPSNSSKLKEPISEATNASFRALITISCKYLPYRRANIQGNYPLFILLITLSSCINKLHLYYSKHKTERILLCVIPFYVFFC